MTNLTNKSLGNFVKLQNQLGTKPHEKFERLAKEYLTEVTNKPIPENIESDANSWVETFILYYLDDLSLEMINKERPKLNQEHSDFIKEHLGSPEFFRKYSKLAIFVSLATHKKFETNSLRFNQSAILTALNAPEFRKDVNHYTNEIQKLIVLKSRPELKKYFENAASITTTLGNLAMQPEFLKKLSDDISKATDDQRHILLNEKNRMLNLIDPSGNLALEFSKYVIAMVYLTNLDSMNKDSKLVNDMVIEIVDQYVSAIRLDENMDFHTVVNKLVPDFGTLEALKNIFAAGVMKMLTSKTIDRSVEYIEMVEMTSLVFQEHVNTANPTNPGVGKYNGLKNVGKVLFFATTALLTIYGINNWKNLNSIDKAFVGLNIVTLCTQIAVYTLKGTIWALKFVSGKLAATFTSITAFKTFTKFAERLSAVLTTILSGLSKFLKLLIPFLNIVFIGIMITDLVMHWNRLDKIGVTLAVAEIVVSIGIALLWDTTFVFSGYLIAALFGVLIVISITRVLLAMIGIGEKTAYELFLEDAEKNYPQYFVSKEVYSERWYFYEMEVLAYKKLQLQSDAEKIMTQTMEEAMKKKRLDLDRNATMTAAEREVIKKEMKALFQDQTNKEFKK
ncbi:hypothetical protein DLAC_06634 [Tieghemostelium lacteum]|uniref:Uncharacterized protein n=1 Tax=Tieghemostelium lacteum TaxID=361077 RepID=A0A151ZF95_TIELA|nr:hypothetical protein DLAC_06634 [Tieghemostelium lacteum]|eukprot:KYQ92638.1 hypothetical protein DLAC_06634 [Tieghemostelium lacteum]